MGKTNDENAKKNSLKKMQETELSNLEFIERVKKRRRESDTRYRLSEEKSQLNDIKQGKKSQDHYSNILQHMKQENMRNVHTLSVASMLMDAAPRLEDLMKFLAGKANKGMGAAANMLGQVTGLWGMPAHRDEASTLRRWSQKAYDNLDYYCNKKNPEDMELRDLKYFTNISEDGQLTQAWADDNITDFFCDEKGNQIPGKAEAFQLLLQEAVAEWVDTIDDDGGYFIVDHGNSQFRMYKKEECGMQDPSGKWVLNPALVLKHYDRKFCYDSAGNFFPPKPDSPTKQGENSLFVKTEDFVRLRDSSTKPLGDFLENCFAEINLELGEEEESTHSPRP